MRVLVTFDNLNIIVNISAKFGLDFENSTIGIHNRHDVPIDISQ